MSITSSKSDDGKALTLKVAGKFDFSMHNDFRKAYKDEVISSGEYVVDLSSTDYLDSSALGMLLLLKEFAESHSSKVVIKNAVPEVNEILRIASFDKLFIVE